MKYDSPSQDDML